MNGMNGLKRLPPYAICSRLVCSQCGDYLSCNPIMISPNNAVICGRCTRTTHPLQAVRSGAFEDAANYFLYPCRNDQCNKLLERQDVLFHEVKCEFDQSGCCTCWKRCGVDNPPLIRPEGMYYLTADDKTHDLITCIHCFGYLSSKPIFIRSNGTHICCRCGPDLQAPPIVRDEPLETILECFIIKCSYRLNGCNERFKFGEEMIEHEAECEFNPQMQFRRPNSSNQDVEPGQPGGKIKGVITTISSGHIYATITPNHFYHQYGQHLDETMIRELQMQLPGAQSPIHMQPMQSQSHPQTPSEQMPQMPKVHAHSKQGSYDNGSRSSISMENHRWDVYTGAASLSDDGKRSEQMEDEGRMYMPQLPVKGGGGGGSGVGVTRNESILYNNVVTEMKYKQKSKSPNSNSPQ